MITFGHRSASWLLVAVAASAYLLWMAARHRRLATGHFAGWLVTRPHRWSVLSEGGALCLALVGVILTLMEPLGSPQFDLTGSESQILDEIVTGRSDEMIAMQIQRPAHDVIILLDASASMAVADTRLGQTRLDYAKEVVDEVIGRLTGQSIALYAFTSELTTIVPLTVDYLYTRLVLRHVGINEGDAAGTDLMEAFDAVQRRHGAGGLHKARTLILLTDGGDTRLERAASDERAGLIEAIRGRIVHTEAPYRLLAVGLGSPAGAIIPDVLFEGEPVRSSLDEELLHKLAEVGGGAYYFADDYSSLTLAERIHDQIIQEEATLAQDVEQQQVELERVVAEEAPQIFTRYFRATLLLGVVALAIAILLPNFRKVTLSLLVLMSTARLSAIEIDQIERTSIQAKAQVEAGQCQEAIELYDALLESPLTASQRLRVQYNRATALLGSGNWKQAEKAYAQVIDAAEGEWNVLRRSHTNRAIAQLTRTRQLRDEDGEFTVRCSQAIALMASARDACQAAMIAEVEETESTVLPADLISLKKAIKEEVAYWLQSSHEYCRANRSRHDIMEKLACGIREESQRLETILSEPATDRDSVLSILAASHERLRPDWEELISDEWQQQGLAIESYSDFQCAQEYLHEGRGWEAYDRQIAAQLGLHEAAGLDRLETVLEERRDLYNRLLTVSRESDHERALERAAHRYGSSAKRLCVQESGDDPLLDALLEKLAARLEVGGASGADEDLWFYRQAVLPEEEVLAGLCGELKQGSVPDSLSPRLWALQEKVRSRIDLSESAVERSRLTAVNQPLVEASRLAGSNRLGDTKQLLEFIDAALCAWSPSIWLQAYLEDWRDRCAETVAASRITAEFLDKMSMEQHRVVDKLEPEPELLAGAASNKLFAAMSDLGLAQDQLRVERDRCALLCVEDAHRALLLAVQGLVEQPTASPAQLLEQGIQEEEFARRLTKKAAEEARREPLTEPFVQLLCNAQRRAVDRVLDFPQQLLLRAEEADSNLQEHPWSKILRLYDEGVAEAVSVERHLQLSRPEWYRADVRQEAVIARWKEALQLLQDPSDENDPKGGGDNRPDSNSDSPSGGDESLAQGQQQAGALSPTELFESLQQMDRDDQNGEKRSLPLKRGLRPW